MNLKTIREFIIEKAIFICGIFSIIGAFFIFIFLITESGNFFFKESLVDFLSGKYWYPTSNPPQFGILPLILGSLLVTGVAILIAVPLGISGAIFIAEIAKGSFKEFLKSSIELISAIPSVVLGFLGAKVLGGYVMNWFNLSTGLTAFTAALLLAFMTLPTIVSIMEDAITAVPRRYKESALAMGATHWQAIYKVILPAAMSGIMAAIMLGIGRAIGETMVVTMASGNAAIIPKGFLFGILGPVKTLTATIATEMGESSGLHRLALFGIALVLFIMTFIVNVSADFLIHRKKS
jgi:phosphate transport system permease protein